MKTFKEFIVEQNLFNEIELELKNIGYTELKKISGKKIAVLTNDNRVNVLEDIASKLNGAMYDTTPKSDSGAGRVVYKGFNILAKPASRQGHASAGVSNEYTFVSTINSVTEKGPINVVIEGKNKSFNIMGCSGAEPVGGDTKGRRKADVVLKSINGDVYPISIKKANAEIWESADSYFSEEATKLIQEAIRKGNVELTQKGGVYVIQPNIAVEATRQEKIDVIFGSDIAQNGAIVTGTFSNKSFDFDGATLKINCDHVATSLRDIERTDKDVFFLIRNDKSRRSIRDYPGLRVLAVYKKRINRNVKVLKR